MYISSVSFKGYKNSFKVSTIPLNKGLNVLLGENGCGKTAVVNALRLALREQEAASAFSADDLYCSDDKKRTAAEVSIDVRFSELSDAEKIIFFTWCTAGLDGLLHLDITENPSRPGTYKRKFWGGEMKSGIFEEDTFDKVECIYLPPLRDAEVRLSNGKRSRLAYVLKRRFDGADSKPLVEEVKRFNEYLTRKNELINDTREKINSQIAKTIGNEMGQSVNLQLSEVTFNKIMENIRMVFFPHSGASDTAEFRDLATNSLGYNNILYIATVFSELELLKNTNGYTAILIEEPEAHLHPQMQIKFIKYIQSVSEKESGAQIIITTHSPILASSVELGRLIHLKDDNGAISAAAMSTKSFGNDLLAASYLNRWLDATKSAMLFSRGVILVEGISEALVLPRLAKIVLKKYNSSLGAGARRLGDSLEDMGVSVININGTNFKPFMKLFGNFDGASGDCIPIRCAGVTDNDPKDGGYPSAGESAESGNPMRGYAEEINSLQYTRLFVSPQKTFEYDLALCNPVAMAKALKEAWGNSHGGVAGKLDEIIERHGQEISRECLGADAKYIYDHIVNLPSGKGGFASVLAECIGNDFNVPEYIENAVLWACGADVQ